MPRISLKRVAHSCRTKMMLAKLGEIKEVLGLQIQTEHQSNSQLPRHKIDRKQSRKALEVAAES